MYNSTPEELLDYETLPRTLEEALTNLNECKVLREYLGDELVDAYVKLKRQSVASYRSTVSQWEYTHELNV
eukprot:UN13817